MYKLERRIFITACILLFVFHVYDTSIKVTMKWTVATCLSHWKKLEKSRRVNWSVVLQS